jgi:crotonobetainyl-CoA:carnitine CoA-transferase CaiB-like acyl-CoA transferase
MDINEVALAPQPNAVGAFTDIPNYPIRQIAHPVKFSVSEHTPKSAAPELGADTRAILSELELSEAELALLLAGGARKE